MAKIAFGKLDLKKNQEVVELQVDDDVVVEVKQYLPVNDKLELVSTVVNTAVENGNIVNYGQLDVLFAINIIKAYTNINFTEKQLEDVAKLYDLLVSSGFYEVVKNVIPTAETDYIYSLIYRTANDIITYRNSAVGIMEALSQDYKNLEFDAEALQKKINDPESLSFLREVLTKMG